MIPAVTVHSYPPPPLREAEILRYAGAPRGDATAHSLLQACLPEIESDMTYRVSYASFPLSMQGDTLDLGFATCESQQLRRCLDGCDRFLLMAATVGLAVDRQIRRYQLSSPAKALMFSAIGSERVESLCDAWEDEQRRVWATKGRALRPRFSPGYGDFPLALQQPLLQTLQAARYLGIALQESLLMMPTKSVTAIVGLYSNP